MTLLKNISNDYSYIRYLSNYLTKDLNSLDNDLIESNMPEFVVNIKPNYVLVNTVTNKVEILKPTNTTENYTEYTYDDLDKTNSFVALDNTLPRLLAYLNLVRDEEQLLDLYTMYFTFFSFHYNY